MRNHYIIKLVKPKLQVIKKGSEKKRQNISLKKLSIDGLSFALIQKDELRPKIKTIDWKMS